MTVDENKDKEILEEFNEDSKNGVKVVEIKLTKGIGKHPYVVTLKFDNGTHWMAGFEEYAVIMEKLAESEEKKYKLFGKPLSPKEWKDFPSGKFILGRNLNFLTWLYPLYDTYLDTYGFKPPQKHLDSAKTWRKNKKWGKKDESKTL